MKKNFFNTLLVIVTILVFGCAGGRGYRGQIGAVGGAAGGALIGQAIGKNTEATLIGAAVGTMLGYIIGNEMDRYDEQQLGSAFNSTPSGRTVGWVNPDTGNQYAVTPRSAYLTPDDQLCRNAEIAAIIDGKREVVMATACRDRNGRWQLQK